MSNTQLTTLNDRLTALKARATQPPQKQNWKPTAGETIAGVLLGGETFNHPLYGLQNAILLETDGGIVSVPASKYIQTALQNQQADKGDLCAITFHGQEISKTGHRFNRYTVLVEKVGVM